MKPPRPLACLAVALLALAAPACDLGSIDLSGPFDVQWSMLRVHAENAGASEFLVSFRGGTPLAAPVGQRVYLFPYTSTSPLPSSDSFTILRGSATLARVTFQPLRFPEKKSDVKDSTIVITEPSPGQFAATAAEPDWIRILSVTPE